MTDTRPTVVASPRTVHDSDQITVWHSGLLCYRRIVSIAITAMCAPSLVAAYRSQAVEQVIEGGKPRDVGVPVVATVQISGSDELQLWKGISSGIDPFHGVFYEEADLSSGEHNLTISVTAPLDTSVVSTTQFLV